MADNILLSLSIIIIISAILTVLARIIKQPPIIAYLITGVIVGPLFLNLLGSGSSELIQTFAHIGVAFLLFIVGLSLDLRVLKEVGKVSTVAGLLEIIITGGIGFLIAVGIGFSNLTALYVGAAIAFSSTVVVVKILSDKKEIDTLHGRIALGILIVEDFVAAIALMLIPSLSGKADILVLAREFAIAIILIVVILLFSTKVLAKFMDYLARNQEVLFLFGIAWALALAVVFDKLGFSLEIGALVAGMSLASSRYRLELEGKIKPLRDFFIILFFVFFGSQLAGDITPSLIKAAVLFSAFVVIGKPILVMTILRIFGYKKRTNFLTGSSLAQISEFSLILILLGFTLGHLSQEIMSLAVMIALITIGLSSYSIYYSHSIFNKISHLLFLFEGNKIYKVKDKEERYDILLFGYHRVGYKILKTLKDMKVSFAVVDYNPKVVIALSKERINTIYGDAGDKNFLSEIPLDKAKLVISTIPELGINITLKEALKEKSSHAVFLATAEQPRMAGDLYNFGVDYVIVPHHLGGDYVANIIKKFGTNKNSYLSLGKKHHIELNKSKKDSGFNS